MARGHALPEGPLNTVPAAGLELRAQVEDLVTTFDLPRE